MLRLAERSVYGAIVSTFLISSAFAQSDEPFARANQKYAEGHFQEAIENYEAIVRSKEWSAPLFYNLGNAYYRVKDFGRALLNYERALMLEPNHPEAQANLRIVRDQTRALELRPGWPDRYLRFATANQFTITATITFWIGVFCIAALIFSRRRSAGMIALPIFFLALSAVILFILYRIENGNRGRSLAVITDDGVEARLVTADNANSVLALPAGSEVKIERRRGDWIHVALPNDLRGWVPAKSVESVRL